jgi:NADH-quinone oxidoreductase subunit I
MQEPPHEMQLGTTEKDYYLGLTGAAKPQGSQAQGSDAK